MTEAVVLADTPLFANLDPDSLDVPSPHHAPGVH